MTSESEEKRVSSSNFDSDNNTTSFTFTLFFATDEVEKLNSAWLSTHHLLSSQVDKRQRL